MDLIHTEKNKWDTLKALSPYGERWSSGKERPFCLLEYFSSGTIPSKWAAYLVL